MDWNNLISIVFFAVVFFVMMRGCGGMMGCGMGSSRRKAERQADEKEKPMTYTCPMHPEVHQNQPGKCPKCSMELAPAGKPASTSSSCG
jgi:hypothetical protein